MEDKKRYSITSVALALYIPENIVANWCNKNGIRGKDGLTFEEIYQFSRSKDRYWRGYDNVNEIKRLLAAKKERKMRLKEYNTRVWRADDGR